MGAAAGHGTASAGGAVAPQQLQVTLFMSAYGGDVFLSEYDGRVIKITEDDGEVFIS
jgi:hypothetical protein